MLARLANGGRVATIAVQPGAEKEEDDAAA